MDPPPSTSAFCARLAAIAHDARANDRIAAGWRYGAILDEPNRLDPRLVPFEKLSDAEQRLACESAEEILAATIALGYRVVPIAPETGDNEGRVADLLERIESLAGSTGEAGALLRIWSSRDENSPIWYRDVGVYRKLARRCLEIGATNVAGEIAEAGLAVSSKREDRDGVPLWGSDHELRRIQGMALARTGRPNDAAVILETLREEGSLDEETLGILAGIRKDIALAAHALDRQRLLDRAIEAYQDAHSRTGGSWTGINVASLLTLRGHREAAQTIARDVRDHCLRDFSELTSRGCDSYWVLATLGEAALNLGDRVEAEAWYRRAYGASVRRHGDVLETNRQAKLLLGQLGGDESTIDRWLPAPRIVIFTGHMIDRPDRPQPRFPASLADRVKGSLREWIGQQGDVIGFSSAACGSDILFQEVVRELGGDTYVVLPYQEEHFRRASVEFADPPTPSGAEPSWRRRFEDVLARASGVVMASADKMRSDDVSYAYANQILHGLALMKARELGATVLGLAVWNGQAGDGHGGSASAVSQWLRASLPVYRVDLRSAGGIDADSESGLAVAAVTTSPAMPAKISDAESRVVAMLFADAVGFSTLTESQVPVFVHHCLGPIGELIRTSYADEVIVRNTWGDGLYIVFTTVDAAGRFALDLADLFTATDWSAIGLPATLAMRIALHAGPVFQCVDPVTGQLACTGTHVSRAARLEPRTPPGRVYASEGFAAIAAIEDCDSFTCEYVKQLSWAKHYGTFPTYILRRRLPSSGSDAEAHPRPT